MRVKWRPYYLNYRGLKERIEELESDPGASNVEFMRFLKSQILKVMSFYDSAELRITKDVEELVKTYASSRAGAAAEKFEQVKVEIEKLGSFAEINCEAIRKISKKYDKHCGKSKTMETDIAQIMKNSSLSTSPERLSALMEWVYQKPQVPFTRVRQPLLSSRTASFGDRKPLRPFVRSSRSQDLGEDDPVLSPEIQRNMLEVIFRNHERRSSHNLGDEIEDGENVVLRSASKSQVWRSRNPVINFWQDYVAPVVSADVLVVLVLALSSYSMWDFGVGQSSGLDWRSYFTIFVTLEALYLLLMQHRPDVVLLFATLILRLAGVIDDRDAWGGFSNPVVLSVAVLGIVSAGAHHTGVIEYVFLRIMGRPSSFRLALLQLSLPAMLLNTTLSNTCLMGVLMPVMDKWCAEISLHPALFLMPMSYLLLISGTTCIFSTSSNLITQSLLVDKGEVPFGNFEISALALACSAAALLYIAIAVPILQSRFLEQSEDEAAAANGAEEASKALSASVFGSWNKLFVASFQVSGAFLHGKTLDELHMLQGVQSVLRWERLGVELAEISSSTHLHQYDLLWIWVSIDAIQELFACPWVSLIALDAGYEHRRCHESRALVEVTLDGLCPLIKEQMVETKRLETEYSASCLGIRPRGMQHFQEPKAKAEKVQSFVAGLRHPHHQETYKFQIGDNLILDVPRNFFRSYENSAHFSVVRQLKSHEELSQSSSSLEEEEVQGPSGNSAMVISGLLLVTMIGLVSSGTTSLLVASLLTTFALVSTGCLPKESAFNAIKLPTIITIVGAFGIGQAMAHTKVAKVLAVALCSVLESFGPRGLLAGIYAATVALGIVFHATAVVILMFPVCEEMSTAQGVPLHQVLAVLMIGAGCQMLSPVSYQTNLMAYSSGYYLFSDFSKLGCGLVVVIGVVCISLVESLVPGSSQ